MREAEDLLQFLYLAPVGLVETDATGHILRMSPLANATLVVAGGPGVCNLYEALSESFPDLRARVDHKEGLGSLIEGAGFRIEGDPRSLSLSVHRISSERLAFVINDVTRLVEQEMEIRRHEAQMRSVVHSIRAHMIVLLDAEGVILESNPSIERLRGGEGEGLKGSRFDVLFADPLDTEEILAVTNGRGWLELSERMTHASGSVWRGASVLTRIADAVGQTIGFSLVTREDNERYEKEQQLTRWATQDALTQATNRRAFASLVDAEIARARRYQRGLSFVLLDIDHFKAINDRCGHYNGDLVLVELADRLRGCIRRPDHLVRLGGEEFGLLLVETALDEALVVAERVREVVASTPFELDGDAISVTISLGVAEWPDASCAFERVYKAADEALYRAKASGRDQVKRAAPIMV